MKKNKIILIKSISQNVRKILKDKAICVIISIIAVIVSLKDFLVMMAVALKNHQ